MIKNEAHKKGRLACLISFSLFLAVIAASFLIYQKTYAAKIYPGVSFLGNDLSGKSLESAKKAIEETIAKANQKKLIVKLPESNIELKPAAMQELGIKINSDKILTTAYDFGHTGNFWAKNNQALESVYKDYEISLIFSIDNDKYNNFIDQVASKIEEEPENATLVYQGGSFVFQPSSKNGKEIDRDKFKKTLWLKLSNSLKNNSNIEIILKTKDVAAVIAKQEQTEEAKEIANRAINQKITLIFEDRKFSPGQDEIASWIIFTEKNKELVANIDNAKTQGYVSSIAKQIDIKPVDRQVVVNADGTPKEVLNEKKDGRALNQDKTLAQIKEAIKNSDNEKEISITIETAAVAAQEKIIRSEAEAGSDASSVVIGREAGKYIDINLSAQRLGIIEGEQIVGVYAVSTGKWSMPTPQGRFAINGKIPRAYSRKYNLYMPFWMAFVGDDYGIHELPEWANGYKEGANHLGTPVSHGCVRLGVGAAETVYNWVEIGTPVYVHK